jgi:hypothetical protein
MPGKVREAQAVEPHEQIGIRHAPGSLLSGRPSGEVWTLAGPDVSVFVLSGTPTGMSRAITRWTAGTGQCNLLWDAGWYRWEAAMSWRDTFPKHLGPGAFGGVPLGDWLRVLRDNRFSVDAPYWGRAAIITLGSFSNTLLRWLECLRFGRRIREAQYSPPLFILGIWRSGTTHLHNLLARDERFAFPNFYQTMFPHTFLSTEAITGKLVGFLLPRTRPQDNVRWGINEPQEDELALSCLTRLSFLLALAFPRRAEHYDRYLTFRGVAEDEIAQWKAALKWFVQKLSFKHGRPLVLKSPGHTGRIRMLLDVFPEAKFVHIHRNPYEVFQSAQHSVKKVLPWWAMQRSGLLDDLDDRTIRQFKEVYDAFFEERDLIPRGRFHEVRFEDLEADPIGQVREMYQALALGDFQVVEPVLKRYVESLAGYRRNAFPAIPSALRTRIAHEWRRCFECFNYSI